MDTNDTAKIRLALEKWKPLLEGIDDRERAIVAAMLQNLYDRREGQKTPLQKFAERACKDEGSAAGDTGHCRSDEDGGLAVRSGP